jgi:hypothetical protein
MCRNKRHPQLFALTVRVMSFMEFVVCESPTDDVAFRRYDAELFPKFRVIFEQPENESLPRFLAQPGEEAEFAVVMEKRRFTHDREQRAKARAIAGG